MASFEYTPDLVGSEFEAHPLSNLSGLVIADQTPNIGGTGLPGQLHKPSAIPSSSPASALRSDGANPLAHELDFSTWGMLDPTMGQQSSDLHFTASGQVVNTIDTWTELVHPQQFPNVINSQQGVFPQTVTQMVGGG